MLAACLALVPNLLPAPVLAEPQDAKPGLQVTFVAVADETEAAEWWYRVPGHMPPSIYPIEEVVLGQDFALVPIFADYGLDAESKAHLTYELQHVTSMGQTVELGEFPGIEAKIQNPSWIQMARPLPRILVDDLRATGTHRFIITVRDHVAETKTTAELEMKILPWDPEATAELDEIDPAWPTNHYRNPRPDVAFLHFRDVQALEMPRMPPGTIDWAGLNVHAHALKGCAPALDELVEDFEYADEEGQRKTALLFLLIEDEQRFETLQAAAPAITTWASAQPRPDPYGALESPFQLDMLWGEFLTTGRYRPVRRIVEALGLADYAGALEAFPTSEQTDEDRNAAYMDAIFQSALWSLESNATQHPRVLQYLTYALEKGELEDQTAAVLAIMLSTREGD